jgi:multidrug efflux pump subunit AcrA (membrane-fusion protein)
MLIALSLTGCGSNQSISVVVIPNETYERMTYSSTEVYKGDLSPSLTLKLKVSDFEKINYSIKDDGLEVDKLYVSVGDKVSAGDVLVSFKSDEIKENIESYQERLQQNELLITHYTNLMKINPDNNYTKDIEMLNEDIQVETLYIEEAQKRLEAYSIVAERSGTITEISEYLQCGYAVQGVTMLTEACGSDNYVAEITDNYDFKVGDTFTAESGVAGYEMKLAEIDDGEGDNSDNNEASGKRTLHFEPVSDMSAVSEQDTLTIQIEKPVMKDVVYVDSAAINTADDKSFVYVLDENGYRDAVFVETGETVDSYTIITAGLNGGEQVTLK